MRRTPPGTENLTRLCERCLQGRYRTVIYDVLQDFRPALEHRVLVTPTLIACGL
jgi:hypothetical protein